MAAPSVAWAASANAKLPYALLGPDWTGPGGIGDYARSNGNVHATVNAAHAVRDGYSLDKGASGGDETYDLVVVGAGLSGLMISDIPHLSLCSSTSR